jgi:hypothetical protein
MKKIISIFVINFCILPFLYGQENETVSDGERESSEILELSAEENSDQEAEDTEAGSKAFRLPGWMTSKGADISTGRQESRNVFELGILGIAMDNVFSGFNLFGLVSGNDSSELDVEKFDSLSVNLNVFTNPLSVRIPIKDIFILDVFTGLDIDITMDMPQKTIDTLKKIESLAKTQDISDLQNFVETLEMNDGMFAGAGAFLEIGVGGSKTLMNGRLWLRAAPSIYFTMIYIKHSGISLKGYNKGSEYGLKGDGAMHLYSAWDLDSGDVNPFSSPGLDLTLEALYALWPVLDTGLSISHIPLVPSTLKHRMSVDVSGLDMYVDTTDPSSLLKFNMPDFSSMITEGASENEQVLRPVRFDFYALVKPFKSPVLIIRPNLGATANIAISGTALFNWGLKVQYNAPKIFSAFIGTGLTESVWAQRIGASFDFRIFELSLSAALAGMDFAESWSGKGFGAAIGFKMGF